MSISHIAISGYGTICPIYIYEKVLLSVNTQGGYTVYK